MSKLAWPVMDSLSKSHEFIKKHLFLLMVLILPGTAHGSYAAYEAMVALTGGGMMEPLPFTLMRVLDILAPIYGLFAFGIIIRMIVLNEKVSAAMLWTIVKRFFFFILTVFRMAGASFLYLLPGIVLAAIFMMSFPPLGMAFGIITAMGMLVLTFRWMLVTYDVFSSERWWKDSMDKSAELTTKHWKTLLALIALALLIAGVFWAWSYLSYRYMGVMVMAVTVPVVNLLMGLYMTPFVAYFYKSMLKGK